MRYKGSDSCSPIDPAVRPVEQTILAREQAEILHCEIDRLPRPFRLPIVLCYFEGLTLDEAAHRSGAPPARSAADWPGRATSSAAA